MQQKQMRTLFAISHLKLQVSDDVRSVSLCGISEPEWISIFCSILLISQAVEDNIEFNYVGSTSIVGRQFTIRL